MLVNIDVNHYINADYIINLFLRTNIPTDYPAPDFHQFEVIAKMIDGTLFRLFQTHYKEAAEKFIEKFIGTSTVHKTHVIASLSDQALGEP